MWSGGANGLYWMSFGDRNGGRRPVRKNAELRRMVAYLRPYVWATAGVLLCIAVASLLALLPPLFIRAIVDDAVPKGNLSQLNWLVIGLVVIHIGAVLYYFLRDYFNDHETAYIIGTGVAAIVVALWLQPGIWGHIRRRLGADLFPLRRRLIRGSPEGQ